MVILSTGFFSPYFGEDAVNISLFKMVLFNSALGMALLFQVEMYVYILPSFLVILSLFYMAYHIALAKVTVTNTSDTGNSYMF